MVEIDWQSDLTVRWIGVGIVALFVYILIVFNVIKLNEKWEKNKKAPKTTTKRKKKPKRKKSTTSEKAEATRESAPVSQNVAPSTPSNSSSSSSPAAGDDEHPFSGVFRVDDDTFKNHLEPSSPIPLYSSPRQQNQHANLRSSPQTNHNADQGEGINARSPNYDESSSSSSSAPVSEVAPPSNIEYSDEGQPGASQVTDSQASQEAPSESNGNSEVVSINDKDEAPKDKDENASQSVDGEEMKIDVTEKADVSSDKMDESDDVPQKKGRSRDADGDVEEKKSKKSKNIHARTEKAMKRAGGTPQRSARSKRSRT